RRRLFHRGVWREYLESCKQQNRTFPFSTVRDNRNSYVWPFFGVSRKSRDGLCMANVTISPSRKRSIDGVADSTRKVIANLGSRSTGTACPEKCESMTIALSFARS